MVAQPTSYRYQSSSPSQFDILVCSDSCQLSPPNTCAEVALQNLGEAYDLYYQDWAGCEAAINGGAYDVAIIDNACAFPANSLFSALDGFLVGGGRVLVNSFDMDAFPANPLWGAAGVSHVADVTTQPPVYRWDPAHPAISGWPSDPLQFDNLYNDDGDKFDALPGTRLLAGYTGAPAVGEGAFALRDDNRAMVSGFCIDNLALRDDDGDRASDCVEVWQALINWLLPYVIVDTHQFHVHRPPELEWLKEVYVNGSYVGAPEDGPFDVTPGDTVEISETLEYTGTFPLFAYITEGWDGYLLEVTAESHSIGAGGWLGGDYGWGVTLFPGASGMLHKTFDVTSAGTITISEWLLPDETGPYSRNVVLLSTAYIYLPLVLRNAP
jgi:hypothetical protein